MRKTSFVALLGVTIILVGAAIYAVATRDRATAAIAQQQRMFPDLAGHLGDLAWMRLSRGDAKVDLNLIAGRWAVVEKGNYPALPGKVRRALLGLADLTLVEPKTARPELFGRLDLDDPGNGTLVTLQDRMGRTAAALIVGKVRQNRLGSGNDAVYVRKPRDDRAWLARGSLDLPTTGIDWLDRRLLDIPAGRIAKLTLTAPDGAGLELRREDAGKVAVAGLPDDAKPKPESILARPVGALSSLEFDDVKPAAEAAGAGEPVAAAVLTTFDGLAVTVRFVGHDNSDWVAIHAAGRDAAEKEAAAINAQAGRWVFATPADRAKLLRTRLADLVEPAGGS